MENRADTDIEKWAIQALKLISDNTERAEENKKLLLKIKDDLHNCQLNSSQEIGVPVKLLEEKVKYLGNEILEIKEIIKSSQEEYKTKEEKREDKKESVRREKIKFWGTVIAAVLTSSGFTYLLNVLLGG